MDLLVVLIKDFDSAKQRLAPTLSAEARRTSSMDNARRALSAALETGITLAVCGSEEAADLARELGAEVLVQAEPDGQNPAAQMGIQAALDRGADGVLILSSDLPLVDSAALRRLLRRTAASRGPLALGAAAEGRQGTNALYLRPPGGFGLHFGHASLPRFAAEAKRRHRLFIAHRDPALALDLDEATDLERLRQLTAPAAEPSDGTS